MAAIKDVLIGVLEMLSSDQFSYQEVADHYGMIVSDVEYICEKYGERYEEEAI